MNTPRIEASSNVGADSPFFTVLIPTMNRPILLESALTSVLSQTFQDYELIISDNSNDNKSLTRNQNRIKKHSNNQRVHYMRPPTWMNMPDHWEFASRHASGRYVVILTDSHVMRPSALQFLHAQIMYLQDDAKVISWQHGSSFIGSGIMHTRPFTGSREVLDSKEELCKYAKCADWRTTSIFDNHLPRMLNSCYRFDVAHKIREKHGRLFMPLNPDYTCAYLLLAYTDSFTFLDRPLFIHHGNQSTGTKAMVYGEKEYLSTLGDVDLFAGTPVPINTLTNTVVRDLTMVRNLVGARLSEVSLDVVGYFMYNYWELLEKERIGSQVNVRSLYAQWRQAVQMLTPEQQIRIKDHVAELDKQRASFTGLRRLAVRWGLHRLYHPIGVAQRYILQRLSTKPFYNDVLEAARQTDYFLSPDRQTFLAVDRSIGAARKVNSSNYDASFEKDR